MNNQEKFTPKETPYKRIMRLAPEGNWTDAAAQLLTNEAEIEQFIEEQISETLRPDPQLVTQHTPESLVDSIKKVINGPNLKTPEKKAAWEKALQKAIEKSDYFPD